MRKTGNTALLLEFLLKQRGAIDAQAKKDCIEINREIFAIAWGRGEITIAEEAINQVLQVEPDDILALNHQANIHFRRGQLDSAEALYKRILKAQHDPQWQATAHGNLGNVYLRRGDLDKAEEMYRKALKMYQALGRKGGMPTTWGMGNTYGNLGSVYLGRGDLDKAEEMYRKVLKMYQALGHKGGMANAYGNLGSVHLARDELDEAERMYRKALAIEEALGRKEGMAFDYGNLGLLYGIRGDLPKARENLVKAREIFNQIPMPHEVEKVQKLLDELDGTRSKK